jgi:hypothetical protein
VPDVVERQLVAVWVGSATLLCTAIAASIAESGLHRPLGVGTLIAGGAVATFGTGFLVVAVLAWMRNQGRGLIPLAAAFVTTPVFGTACLGAVSAADRASWPDGRETAFFMAVYTAALGWAVSTATLTIALRRWLDWRAQQPL